MSSLSFSLIVATVGRYDELDRFLSSIVAQRYDLSLVEVILVDQNDKISLDPLIAKYSSLIINLIHIKSERRGVSHSRNIGISNSKGKILAFPDDDCVYYPDTLEVVSKFFDANPNLDFLLGGVFNKDTFKKEIRDWPKKKKFVNKYNFFGLYTMITLFTKSRSQFDESFGGGARYCAYEDCDFVFSHIQNQLKGVYDPSVRVSHPPLNIVSMDDEKIAKYGFGFGALCAKNRFMMIFFFLSVFNHTLHLLCDLACLNFVMASKRKISIFSRFSGLLDYDR
jgi:glycosyltransferase involved in cell wall biosynthesis